MATVTNEEYQKVKQEIGNQFTSDSYQQYEKAYNDYMAQWMSSNDAFNKASWLLVKQTANKDNSYQNQWSWNYVYNEKTWYYENQTAPERNTTNQNINNDIKQGETVVKTDTEIKQEWKLKPLSQEYYNQESQASQDKIIANLNQYRQTNPEYFSNYENFKKNFSYDSRNDIQKNTLDTWYKWYTKGLELGATPVSDLYTQYKDGQISTTDLETLRISNPTKYGELINQINRGNIISAYDDDKGTEAMNFQDMAYKMMASVFSTYMSWDTWVSNIFSDYEEKMNSPEMLDLSDQATEYQNEIENIQDDIATMTKAVEKEYEGTGASRAKINAIIADRTYELQLQLRTANSNYNKVATQYNNRMQQYQNEYTMQVQEYQLNMQAKKAQMDELGFAMDLMNFETNEQKAEREWNYWVKQQQYTNGDINSKDYSTRYKAALKSVENLLSQYEGIPMERSAEQMAQDILKAIDNWSNLGTELTKINKLIQQKPEYKQVYNATYGVWANGIGKTYKIWDTEYVMYNDKLYTADQFNKLFGSSNTKPYDAVDEKVFENNPYVNKWYYTLWEFLVDKRYQTWNKWWQCAKFVNDYLEKIWVWRYFGTEDITTRASRANSNTPKVWTIAIFDYDKKSSDWINHWHVAIVTNVNEDGSFDVIESNYPSWETIGTRTIYPWSTSLKWFFDPSQWAKASTSEASSWIVSWSIEWIPLTYERAVKNLVPAALQNSDAEREALNTIITNAYNGWIDQSEIALKFMGFDIKNKEDKDLAMNLVNTVRTLTTDTQEWIVQTISDLMNQWDYKKAIQTVENAVSKQAKEAWNYVSEASVKNTINKSNELANYMSWLKDSPVWVVEWTMQEWLGRLSSKDSKEITNRIALIESSLDIKDKDTLARIVPQLSDQPSVFMSKLTNLWNNAMMELNWWRTIYWLPELTQDAVLNPSNRVNLYKNSDIIQQQTQSWTARYEWLPTTWSNTWIGYMSFSGYNIPENFYEV